jgi:hypothetical protein
MNLVDLLKKNIVMVPVVASLVVGTFTGVRYIVNLTSAEATWQMAENLYRQLADQVREHDYDIKDLSR